MKCYIKLDGNKIINWYKSTQDRQDIEILLKEYEKLIYNDNNYYTLVDREVIKNDKYTAEELEKKENEELIKRQIANIDQVIAYEMTRGYDFEGGTMSTSPSAQMNWSNVLNRYNAGMTIKTPFPVSLKDGGVYMIDKIEDVIELFKNASEEIESRHNVLLIQRSELL